MRLKRRKEIIVETEELTLVRRIAATTTAWCPKCNTEVQAVTYREDESNTEMIADQEARRIEGYKSGTEADPVGTRLRCEHGLDSPWEESEEVAYEE